MGRSKQKVAIVTGGSRGVGRAVAAQLAREDILVVVNYARSAAEASEVVAQIEDSGGAAIAVQADIARIEEVRRLFRVTVELLGRLDILIANAGISIFKPVGETTEEDFDRIYSINARGTFFCLQEALRHMSDGGRIVCVSTIGTELNLPGGACYFGSKASVEQFCRVLAKEVAGRRITVNVVSPGFVETRMLAASLADDPAGTQEFVDMTPLGRLGRPSDIAEAIAFLVRNESGWITRQNIAVDGGIISR
jgi:3-oxoacyl-[acyl-carrier protein] reductase